ncbi:MAG: hypothetical protein A2901_04270 [Elusimicrobia bacterium RIFCSPLOWO2_01_FULL_54_10]|nr:MAG: hypothetical protein A2901_04270 [Elusimicrobia bacterium RIFCSPLOWO2_01_FULL_54_10]
MAKILVVDDEPDMIWAITHVLLSEGHSVVSVNSGEEALVKVKDAAVGLVLLDFRLPGMDGIQILEKIKQARPELPVIMVTGYGGIEEAVQAIKLGAAHYISKPFDNSQLVESVNKALQVGTLKTEGLFGKRLAEKIAPGKAKDILPKAPHKNQLWLGNLVPWSAGITLFFLFFLGGIYFWKGAGASDKEFLIGHSKVSGLAFSGTTLWVTDWFTEQIERYAWDGKNLALAGSVILPGAHLTGIAAGPDFIFTCDSWKKQIHKHARGDRLTIIETFPSPGPEPSGLFYDGKYLWSCDGKTRKIYQHALDAALTVLAEYDSPAQFPVGLFHDGVTFWTAGAVGTKIYKNTLTERFKPEGAYAFKESPVPGKSVSAFTLHDGQIWATYEGINRIYRRNPKKLLQILP